MTEQRVSTQPRPGPIAWFRAHALYPNMYVWYIFASSLDIIMTYAIIYRLGGREVNALAGHLLDRFGHWGLIGLKYSTVLLVVAICEIIGRKHPRLGWRLALAAIILSALPVGAAILQVWAWVRHDWSV